MKFSYCKICKRCCNNPKRGTFYIFISKREFEKLPSPNARKVKGGYRLITKDEKCQYLSLRGCTLKQKPIGCEVWPFWPTKKGWILNVTTCFYWFKFSKKELGIAKMQFAKRRKEWIKVQD